MIFVSALAIGALGMTMKGAENFERAMLPFRALPLQKFLPTGWNIRVALALTDLRTFLAFRRRRRFTSLQGGKRVAAKFDRTHQETLHPVHAVLLAATVPLFLGALLSDLAYSDSYEVQWTNFASWLIVGGLIFSGPASLWALIDLIRADRRAGRTILFFLLVLAAFVLGFCNALVHAKDAWAAYPAGLILSAIVLALTVAATWVGFSSLRARDVR